MALLETPDGPIHYDLLERSDPWVDMPDTIVFQHGLGACAQCWSGWVPALLANYRLVFVDLRGHGRSPVADDYQWSLKAMVGDLHAVISQVAPGGCHLVGESIGGTLALAYAVSHCERLKSLTVCNGAHAGVALGNLANWREIIASGGMSAWSDHMMAMRFADGTLSPAMWRWYREQQARCDQRSVLDAVDILAGADLSEQLNRVTVPSLLLHPDSSPFIPLPVMAELKDRLPNARLQVFADTRHGLPFIRAGECSAALATFLATLSESA